MNETAGHTPDAEHIGAELRAISDRVSAVSTEFAAFTKSLSEKAAAASEPAAAEPAAESVQTPATPPAPKPTPAATQVRQLPPQAPAQPHVQYSTPPRYGQPPAVAPINPQGWNQGAWNTTQFVAPYPGPARPRTPRQPAPQAKSFSERVSDATERGLVGKILAAVGVGITLIGVVLLLILAAQAGLLRPEIRVAGGAVFAAALVGVGAYIGRREEKRSGAVALVATGVAAGLFDVLAATSIYHWLPEAAALILGAVISAGGLGFAHRWNSQTLGLMVSIPLLVFAPIVSQGVDEVLVGFMLTYAAVTLWLQVGRDWTALFLINTAAASIPLVFAVAYGQVADWYLAPALILNVVLAVVSATLLLSTSTQKELIALTSACSALPIVGAHSAFDAPLDTVVAGITTAVMTAAVAVTVRRSGIPLFARAVWATSAAILLSLAVMFALGATSESTGALASALVVIVGAMFAGDLRRVLLIVGSVFTGLGLASIIADQALAQLVFLDHFTQQERTSILVGVVFGLVTVTVLAWAWTQEAPAAADRLWISAGLVNLWLVTQLCVAATALATGGSGQGFRTGHTIATVIWFGTAAAALLWARSRTGSIRAVALSAGLVLIAASVAKLFLFDLAALNGFLRVIAFLVAGILLLVLGVAYAQSLTGKSDGPAQADAESVPAH